MSETDQKITDEAQPSDSSGAKDTGLDKASPEPEKKAEQKKSGATKSESKPEKIEKKKSKPVPEKTKSGRGVAVLALFIALIAILGAGFIGWKGMDFAKSQPEVKAELKNLQGKLDQQEGALSRVAAHTQPFASQISDLTEREQRLLSRVDVLSRKVRELEGSSRAEWQLAEVEYLMRLANQRMLMGTDISSSRNLLNSADQILAELDDYSLFPVREALAEDMAALKATTDFDKESTYLRLQTLNNLIPKLELKDQHRLKTTMPDDIQPLSIVPEEAETSNWKNIAKQTLLGIWQEFVGLFRINTNREEPIEVLLSGEQQQGVRHNLRLMIEQAKLAVLTREQAIYRNSLEQADEWLNRYFTSSGEATNAMSETLAELKMLEVAPSLPDINRSLEALKFYRMGLETPAPQPMPAGNSTLPALEPLQETPPETPGSNEVTNNEESTP